MMKYFDYLRNSVASGGRTVRRNQPCCIKNVKWFCTTLVERFESLTKLQYARQVTNGNRAAYSRCAWETVAFVGGKGRLLPAKRAFLR